MALKATVFKAELQISDMDRHYYATHALTLARHPSETDERLMVRVLAFAMHADDEDRLQFGRGLSSDDEPDLWWEKVGPGLARCSNLTVIDIAADTVAELAALAERGMRLQCMIQDGHVEMYAEGASVTIQQAVRMAATDPAR